MNTDLTERILGAVFEVSNPLGAGFLEKVYERALLRELRLRGITAVSQSSFPVIYKGECVGEYFGDILVEGDVLIGRKILSRAFGSMFELSAGFWSDTLPVGELSEADCAMEADRAGVVSCSHYWWIRFSKNI